MYSKKIVKSYRSEANSRFSQLAALGETVFHISDLATLWGIEDKNTLHTTLARYAKQGLIHRIWRGMYSVKPADRLDPLFVGAKAIHSYTYISTESILFQAGIINRMPAAITFVGGTSRRFTLLGREYLCRKLADRYLFQSIGVEAGESGVGRASTERAVADILYFNPKTHLDAPVDWDVVRRIQRKIGYQPTPTRYRS